MSLEFNKIYNEDCIEGMRKISKNSIDLMVVDPPFTFGLGSSINNTKLDNWTDLLNGSHFFSEVWRESKRILRRNSGMWVFNSWRSLPCLMKSLSMNELKIESLLVWYKNWIGPGGPKGLRPSYEVVALICNGDFGLPNRNLRDVQTFKWSSSKPNHPAEKPLKLVRWLIDKSGNIETVIDPFMGSGTTAVACKQLNKDYIGFELNPKYYDIAIKRIKNVPYKKIGSYL